MKRSHFHKHGRFAGWQEYRYGSAKPIKLAPVFRGDKRKSIIDAVVDLLDDWRNTAFQYEGVTVASLRSGLCLLGYEFPRSDAEARAIVGEAFRKMGAERPTWLEVRGDKPGPASRGHEQATRLAINRLMARQRNAPRTCSACHKTFRPESQSSEQKYCSKVCYAQAVVDALPTLKFECHQCGTSFDAKRRHARFCSIDCREKAHYARRAGRRNAASLQWCSCCHIAFIAKTTTQKYCSQTCAYSHRRSAAQPNIVVFTPALFDSWFAEAA